MNNLFNHVTIADVSKLTNPIEHQPGKNIVKKWENIIVHCSASEWGCARTFRNWHLARGWRDIGYHFVIQNGYPTQEQQYFKALDGQIECGRYLDGDLYVESEEVGAHALGYNSNSIGVCLVGNEDFSFQQRIALLRTLDMLIDNYGISPENVLGHCETESGKRSGKTCPNIDIQFYRDWFNVVIN